MAKSALRKDPNYIFVESDRKNIILQNALMAGASRSMIDQNPFRLNETVRDITIASDRMNMSLRAKKQIESYKELWDDPFHAPYIFCVSSTPSEIMAQMVATRLFLRATAKATKLRKGMPRWHPIYGGIRNDDLRDNDRDRSISLLVCSNVPYDATPYKLEKLRDILCQYNNIPRIIATSSEDPIAFMADKLHMPVNYAMYLGVKRQRRI